MSSDKSDKTLFGQPSVDGDRTIMRPMPGGRGGNNQQPLIPPSDEPSPFYQPAPNSTPAYHAPLPPSVQAPEPEYQGPVVKKSENAYFNTHKGLNPLVNSASILIAVFEKTRISMSHPDVGGLHQRLVNEIKAFELNAKEIGIKPEIVLSARYVACVALDEAVLNTPWGSESGWNQRTLLSIFHNETSGGEKFFNILERMKEQPGENLDIIELMYIFLSLGFEGKYRVTHRGRDIIEQIRDDLYAMIRRQRGEYERSLSPNWQGLGNIRNSLRNYIPLWVVASIISSVLFLSYSGFRVWLYDSSSMVVNQLDEITDMRTVARNIPRENIPRTNRLETKE
ncbi:Outer membrane protein ImpK/VasF, OmpA/MotB domain [hydrothermal vent metagenome]|uniref:Outer membrane protein ImpK/VasF, OmpA/MotB domain n=1 Tax=hydrothermal vent metagenome TaxID=652676 RepID=A0A3B0WN83_9ZZZZ